MPDSRIAFADTNWLVSTYHRTRDSAVIAAWNARGPATLVVSGPLLAEVRCAFWRLGNRWSALESDLRAGSLTDCGLTFEALVPLADDLFRRYAPRCNAGTLDLLHIAAARQFGCHWFLSFDSNSGCRAVASAAELKVFPALNATDRDWLRKFRG
ncbi:MAG: PIN domain-containing protein [Limisphaerales bacterium]